MKKSSGSQFNLLKEQAKYRFDRLSKYATALESLLNEKIAKEISLEVISDAAAKSRNPSYEPEDPSEEFFLLRDSFPMILRGSLLPYIHSEFEVLARSIANLYLPGEHLGKNTNAKTILKRVNDTWPSTRSESAYERLADYKHLRDACAHTAGRPDKTLYEREKVVQAATRTPGAVFKPYLEDLKAGNNEERLRGQIEFQNNFLSEAIKFHASLIDQIARAVVTPPKAVA